MLPWRIGRLSIIALRSLVMALASNQYSKNAQISRDRKCPSHARPIVKWAGGKRQLLSTLKSNLPVQFGRYFEPMVGGGALLFHLKPENACIGDVNAELVNLYQVVRDEVEELIEDLSKHIYEKEYFYQLREVDRSEVFKSWESVQKASRFLYLNRSCFNGLYRVNSSGYFNVPFGRYTNPRILDAKNLRACSKVLQNCEIDVASFDAIADVVKPGDFVYFDPPYVPLTATANFTSYTKAGFDVEMQIALRDLCVELDRRGVKFLLSNSSAPLVLGLYRGFDLQLVDAARAINSNAKKRGKIKEALVKNY